MFDAKGKLSVMVIAGGASESLDARPNTNLLTLNKRKGFVRIALIRGIPLVPVFSFGEYVPSYLKNNRALQNLFNRNNLYDQVANPDGSFLRRLQNKILSVLGMKAN